MQRKPKKPASSASLRDLKPRKDARGGGKKGGGKKGGGSQQTYLVLTMDNATISSVQTGP